MGSWKFALFGLVVAVAGCSFANDNLLPTLTGEEPSGKKPAAAAPASSDTTTASSDTLAQTSAPGPVTIQPAPPPVMSTGVYQPVPIESGKATGTQVGQKVEELRGQLNQLERGVAQHSTQLRTARAETVRASEQYYKLVGEIDARLQVGTTPGNPILVNAWSQAQTALEKIDSNISSLNSLSTGVANDSSVAAFMLESTRAAYGLIGAVDEDHRQLAVLEDEVNKTVVSIDRLLSELSEDISRQSIYIARERSNLNTLSIAVKNGELLGGSLANRAYSPVGPLALASQPSLTTGLLGGRRPLVVIRFDHPQVDYEQALYTAVSRALERKPSADFDLVAVAPSAGSTAQVALAGNQSKRNADAVMRSLINMGLPAARMSLSATTSASTDTNEVLVYAR
jgi:hypothetical protein